MIVKGKNHQIVKRGERVYLRFPVMEDCQEFLVLNRASARFHRGWAYPPKDRKQFAGYLARCQRDDFRGLLVCLKSDGRIIGSINLSQIFRAGFQSAYMGYYVGADYARQGYMTEAVGLALDYAFRALKLHRVEANIQPHNQASIALVKRLGFTLEGYSRRYLKIGGRWRDHERWAILVEDWKRRRTTETRRSKR